MIVVLPNFVVVVNHCLRRHLKRDRREEEASEGRFVLFKSRETSSLLSLSSLLLSLFHFTSYYLLTEKMATSAPSMWAQPQETRTQDTPPTSSSSHSRHSPTSSGIFGAAKGIASTVSLSRSLLFLSSLSLCGRS